MAKQRNTGRPSGADVLGDLQGRLKTVTGGASGWFDWVWVGGALIAGLIVMTTAFTAIEPGQVAVRINNVTGGLTTVTQPGWITRLPFGIHSVYVLEASPQTFSMHGARTIDDLEVSQLTVRASDGSNFHFTDTTIIFQIAGDEAQTVVRDAGAEKGYLKWMRPYARASEYVFPGRSRGYLANVETVIDRVRAREGLAHFTPHDLRRTAASYMTGLGHARLIVKKVLNHVDRDVTAIYDRHGYDAEKRTALEAWGRRVRAIVGAVPDPGIGPSAR